MSRSTGAFVLMLGGALFAQDIHFKTRTFQAVSQTAETELGTDGSTEGIHKIIQFDHSPGVEDLDALFKDGIEVVGALPDNAVVVSAPAGQVPAAPGRVWIGKLHAADKISAELPTTGDAISAILEFHSDVTRGQQETVASAEGLTLLRPAVLRPDHAIVTGTVSDLTALAAHDEVAYIFPADPDLLVKSDLMPCAGMLTSSGPVGQYANIIHGWDLGSDNIAHLGYFFGSVTPKVPAITVQGEIVRALTEWTRFTNILFQPSTSASAPRTVVVKFVSGAHGDPWPFDGPGGVLAHTFYPVPVNSESVAGDMHLDADENWHAGGDLDIYSVALHEAGHAIGLGHSDKVGDVMYPYYRNRVSLSANDIGAAQVLYGTLTAPAPVSNPVPSPVPPTAALRLLLDAAPASTQNALASLTGTLAGGATPYSVQWQTDRGYSGRGAVTGKSFTVSGITLANGANNITVTAFDSARQSASQTVSTLLSPSQPPPSAGGGPPVSISIHTPASAVTTINATSLTVSGIASAGTGVSRVTWQTAAGATGVATGTGNWLAQGIPLLVGTNTIIVRAWDEKGRYAWAALVAVRH